MSNITLNIVEPGSPTPVDPGIDPAVPNTGLFTHGIGSTEATIIVSTVLILAIVGIILVAYMYRKQKKTGKVTKLVHIIDQTKAVIKSKKRITAGLAAISLLVSVGTFIALTKNGVNAVDTDNQAEDEAGLTVSTSDQELTIEVGDEPVFAVLPVEVTVEEATVAGYTLTAYTDNTDLVSTTDSSKVIPMVTIAEADAEAAEEEAAEEAKKGELTALTTLTDNTYGLALGNKPTSKDDKVYTSLSTDIDNPTILKTIDDYTETPANDTTTIYYAFYITPDIPYGTYTTNSAVVYEAIPSLATITYDAYGLYYNNDESFTTNIVGYKPSTSESPIAEITGEYLTPAPLNSSSSSDSSSSSSPIHYTFLGWSKTEGATTPDYEDEEDIIAHLTLAPHESLTLHAVWHYDTVLSFDGNTNDGGTAIPERTIPADTTITLPSNTYTKTHAVFTHWNTVKNPTPDNPGRVYEDGAPFTTPADSSDITLYAQWAYTTTITFNGNGATSGSMTDQTIIAGTPETLTPNAFTKTNATFIGWNTVQNPTPQNPGTSYTDQAEFTASTSEHQDITLYAQWAYTTISFNGNTSDSGSMEPITIAGGTTTNLSANTFTKTNCIFTGWNTVAAGTGTSYGNSSPYQASANTTEELTLYAQWQCVSQVNYYGNGATSGQMASSIILGGSTLTLSQNAYTKDGYIFNGWNTVQNPTTENPGTSYEDQGTFTAPMTPATTLNLYAQWMQPTMQNVSAWGSSLSQGDSMQVPDTRDGKSYWVARLADGNIWMTQNLDLDIEADRTYTSADTDLANSTIGTSWTPTVSTSTTSSWTSSDTAPSSYNPGDLYWNGNVTTSGGNLSDRTTTEPSTTYGTHYHVGNYYNWTAAVAMNDSSSYTTQYTDVNQSICPAGWRLPTYSGDKSYLNLKNTQGFTSGTSGNIQSAPTYFVYGGGWNGSSDAVGNGGNYWSSVVYGSNRAYRLNFGADGGLGPQVSGLRASGFSIRCVAR